MFDLDAYLRRIGHRGPCEPTLATLRALCAAQPAAVPFENIDPLLGRPPTLALDAVQAKLVGRRRGGYCYELNALLGAAMRSIGLRVVPLAARVVWMQPAGAPLRARSHMLLKVELPDDPSSPGAFIADAAFGGHLLGSPLRLPAGTAPEITAGPAGRERIVRCGDVEIDGEGAGAEYAVEAELPTGWQPMYRFMLDAQLPVDYEPLNWYTATHPASLFVGNLLVERLTPWQRAGLLNDRLTLQPHGAPPQTRRIESAEDLGEVLGEVFGIDLPVPAADLFERIPKGFDGPCTAGPR